ncbi:immunity 53 family protein [Paenibacillus sp. FSL W8-0194]|uniref:immunity 53 family protein n=1 Tax=Paenibacillus sp. FSL W8-0194 TaxID=2921711 RepID=UPI0030DD3F04
MDLLKWIEEWFANNCDGDWEHSRGIRISTLDNPGWSIYINLEGTSLEEAVFQPVVIERSEIDWVHCNIQEMIFRGFGGSRNLNELLSIFKHWTETFRK